MKYTIFLLTKPINNYESIFINYNIDSVFNLGSRLMILPFRWGMSIGRFIETRKNPFYDFVYPYPNKEFKGILIKDISNNYDAIQFTLKDNDTDFIIHNISQNYTFQINKRLP